MRECRGINFGKPGCAEKPQGKSNPIPTDGIEELHLGENHTLKMDSAQMPLLPQMLKNTKPLPVSTEAR